MQTGTKARAHPRAGATAAEGKARPQHAGGLIIKCKRCGTARAFYTHKPLERYHCLECKAYTPLPPELAPVEVICECGKIFKYQTNVTDPRFDARCVECSAPVAVEYDEKSGRYCTIGAERRDRRRPGR